MKLQNIFGILLRHFTILAVFGVIILAISIYLYSFYEIFKVIKLMVFEKPVEGQIILQSLKAIDAVLLGVIFFIIGTGLFELFIQPIENLPKWLQMKNIDQLKAMLIKVIVVVMGVSFTGRIVTWDGTIDILGYGVGMGAVVLSLSYFLNVKLQEEKEKKA